MYKWESIASSVDSMNNMESLWVRRELGCYPHTQICDRLFFRSASHMTVEVAAVAQDHYGNYYVVPPDGNVWSIPNWDAKQVKILGSIEGRMNYEERRAHHV